MRLRFRFSRLACALCLGAGLLAPAVMAHGQMPQTPQVPKKEEPKKEEAAPPSSENNNTDNQQSSTGDTGDSASSFDSAVGYIDNAVPVNLLRLRFDDAWHNNRPSRAEYFYARGGPFGPGFKDFPGNINYQELSAYMEAKASDDLSFFLNVPYRFLQPQFDTDQNGFGDLDAGFKWAFYRDDSNVATFQLRTYAPTGYARDGLGTRHVSIEPAFLMYNRLSDKLVLESELRYWAPIGGTDFAGDIVRYGVGVSYGEHDPCGLWLTPVVEFVGWTVLSGKEQVAAAPFAVKDAAGDTIVNAKAGVRAGWGQTADVYVGYGRALTGAVWYKDLVRVELRLHF